ncbi:ChaC-like protein [Penicillium canescens]|uniref:glutathione-specific gamma-glutamylcyclotransferase n=1 Tax=Penicillium canescens TaxID=5083 RepID=A0AAD6I1P1_PENCN|nr:ChaC-like protein [Penicillium canescens]KAJ6009280.1 ChaC-like protein [Penicillium canescens]KAJ6027211.1 ChaC-like protein [Penicillium canescens]KAJ6040493.1 ChaC-like protein [Penicillium canescens]KAJ6067152.1 ChaC-like protein [Penicillium canescens]KAJ6085669.1 ChaC-like protein [Penicillium canescens]
MAATAQGHQVHPDGRTWKSHFPKGDLWVFGYGSLIWKPPPHFDQRVPGYISGYVRRFWQASTDHRGTPETPGRVVTVIERTFWETLDDPLARQESESASTGKVWGAAYHIPASHAEEVHDYLDDREIDGYSAHYTPFHPTIDVEGATSSSPIICMVYIGQPSNPQFLREAARREPQDVAQVISAGHGLSGKNTEYLYLLEKALEGLGLGTADVHVTDLVRRVKAIEAEGLGEAEEKAAELEVTKSLEGAAEAPAEADGRSTIE